MRQARAHERKDSPLEGIRVTIEDLAHDGRGVARHDNKAVFVTDALPGETVELDSVRHRRNYDEARAARILTASPDRVEPRCPHHGLCGGCTLQHLRAPAQLAAKEQALRETLKRIGGVSAPEHFDPITGPAYGYRRKARLGVKWVSAKERVVVGFRERSGRFVTDAQECSVLAGSGPALPRLLGELIGRLSIRAHCPQVEFAAGDTSAALVLRVLKTPSMNDIECLSEFARQQDLAVWLQPGGPGSLQLLHGPALLGYGLSEFGVALHFLPTDFVQINAFVNRALVRNAVSRLDLRGDERVLELYSGIGNFSLALARCAREVVTVEGDPALVRRARANAEANSIRNVRQHVADLSEAPHESPWLHGRFDAVMLDPPRSGARVLVPALKRIAPKRILYVSCHPGTLARDAASLAEAGFKLQATGVADMFPHTAHAEAMALFTC